jgi:hypothetical protein
VLVAPFVGIAFTLATFAVILPNAGESPHKHSSVTNQEPKKDIEWSPDSWTAIFTGILAVIALGQAFLFFYQLRLIREGAADAQKAAKAAEKAANAAMAQTELARAEFVATHRPWLSAEPFPGNDYMTFGPEGSKWAQIIVGARIKNHGNSPAVAVRLAVAFVEENELAFKNALARMRAGSKVRNTLAGAHTIPIFPNEQTVLATNASKQVQIDGGKQWVDGFIIGCVSYQFPFGGEGETTFCCTIARKTPSAVHIQGGWGILPSDGHIPADDLLYIRFPIGNAAT